MAIVWSSASLRARVVGPSDEPSDGRATAAIAEMLRAQREAETGGGGTKSGDDDEGFMTAGAIAGVVCAFLGVVLLFGIYFAYLRWQRSEDEVGCCSTAERPFVAII